MDDSSLSDRKMSARARKRQKETISGLTDQIQEYMKRNGLLEQISSASANIVSVLAEENRLLRLYIVEQLGPAGLGASQAGVAQQADGNNNPSVAGIVTQLQGNRSGFPQQIDGGSNNNPFLTAIVAQLQGVNSSSLNTNPPLPSTQAAVTQQNPFYDMLPTNEPWTSHYPCSSPYEAQQGRQSHSSPRMAACIPAASLAQALANRRASSIQFNLYPRLQRLCSVFNSHAAAEPKAGKKKAPPAASRERRKSI
jgi:hypothetical protein